MDERVEKFVINLKGKNERGRRLSNQLFVCFLMSIALMMLEQKWAVLPLVAELLFIDKFYQKYLLVDSDGAKHYFYEIMRVHAMPIDSYFEYISRKLRPYQLIIGLECILAIILSDTKIITALISIVIFLLSFLLGEIKKRIFLIRLTSSSRSHYVFSFFEGLEAIISMVFSIIVSAVFAFLGLAIVSGFLEKKMIEGEIWERGEATPAVMVVFFLGMLIWEIWYGFGKINFVNKILIKLGQIATITGLLALLLSARFWYYEINYSNEKIKIVHIREKEYDFSDIIDYGWKVDEDYEDEEEPYSYLVLHFNDGTVLDLEKEGAYTSYGGNYEAKQKELWPESKAK